MTIASAGSRFKIQSITGPRNGDREAVIGHVRFVWDADDFDQVRLTKLVKNDSGEWTRRTLGTIDGAARFRLEAEIVEYTNKKTGETGELLSIDGVELPHEVSDAVLAQALPNLAPGGAA